MSVDAASQMERRVCSSTEGRCAGLRRRRAACCTRRRSRPPLERRSLRSGWAGAPSNGPSGPLLIRYRCSTGPHRSRTRQPGLWCAEARDVELRLFAPASSQAAGVQHACWRFGCAQWHPPLVKEDGVKEGPFVPTEDVVQGGGAKRIGQVVAHRTPGLYARVGRLGFRYHS